MRFPGTFHALGFDGIPHIAEACGVDERDRQAADVHALGHQIAGRPGDVGDDRPRCADEAVEQARFARVRAAGNHDETALTHHAPRVSFADQRLERFMRALELEAALVASDEVEAFVRKIQRRLQPRSQVEQPRVDAGDGSRQRALELVHCRARLQRRDGIDQIGDGLCLDQVEPAVQMGPQRELARLAETRAQVHGKLDDPPKQNHAAVAADLDDVIAGKRPWRSEPGDNDLVQDANVLALVPRMPRLLGVHDVSERGVPGTKRPRPPHQSKRDPVRVGAREAHHPDASAPWRRRDGDDGVSGGEQHSASG